MSFGNQNDQGGKLKNYPYQLANLKLLEMIANNTAIGSGADYELVTTYYKAIVAGPGFSIGDSITRTQVYQLPAGTLITTFWFNQSTGLPIAAPPIASIQVVMPATAVTVNNLPVVLGQALMANSLAVTIASNQSALPVTNPNLDVALSTLNREATQLAIQALLTTIDGDTSNLDVALSTRASEVTLLTRLSKADFEARINTLGQKAMAASTPVVLASDQSSIPVVLAGTSGVPIFTNVASAVADTALFAANTSRKGATIFNDSTQVLYVKFAAGASATSYTVQLEGNGYYEVPFGYTGIINGFWAVANGNARLTELT